MQVALLPSMRAMPAEASARLHQIYGPSIDRFMPVANLLACLCGIVVFADDPDLSQLSPTLTLAGVLAMAATAGISVGLNMPIDRRLYGTPAGSVPDYPAHLRQWARYQTARCLFALVSLACFDVAAVVA